MTAYSTHDKGFTLHVEIFREVVMKPKLVVKMTKDKGRGVFANCKIKKGEIIEIAPVIVLTAIEQKVLWKKQLGAH